MLETKLTDIVIPIWTGKKTKVEAGPNIGSYIDYNFRKADKMGNLAQTVYSTLKKEGIDNQLKIRDLNFTTGLVVGSPTVGHILDFKIGYYTLDDLQSIKKAEAQALIQLYDTQEGVLTLMPTYIDAKSDLCLKSGLEVDSPMIKQIEWQFNLMYAMIQTAGLIVPKDDQK